MFFLLVVLSPLGHVLGDTFSSTSEMAELARREEELVGRLRAHREELGRMLEQARRLQARVGSGIHREVGEAVEVEVEDEDSTAELKLLLDGLPGQEEMEGAAQGIFLLQVPH